MDLNWNIILRISGALFIVISAAMIPSSLVSYIYNEPETALAFTKTIIPSIVIGGLLLLITKSGTGRIKVRDGYIIVALCWILSSLIAAVPFVLSGAIPNVIDAFFETSSGFSTTGASILTDVEVLSKGLLFWRSFTHWLGGMGILIFAIALLPSLGINGQAIAKAEAPGPTLDKLTPKLSDTAKRLYTLYFGFTLILVLLLKFGGLSLYDSLVHSFGTIATGGFSIYNNSIGHYDNAYVEMVIAFFMIIAGVNFNLYFILFRQGFRGFFQDLELRFFLFLVLTVTLVMSLNLYAANIYESLAYSFRYAFFQIASIISTTGYITDNYDLWPTFSKILLLVLMLIGASSSSTSGGMKVIRILVIFKFIKRGIALRLHPSAIVHLKFGNKALPIDTVSAIASFIFLYIMTIFISTLLISTEGHSMMTNFSAVIACLGNVGPGFDQVGAIMNYSLFSNGSTLLLAFLMLAGRLELFTIILLLSPRFWNPNR